MPNSHSRRRAALTAVKALAAAGIFVYLFYSLRNEPVFSRLASEPKHWGRLAIAQVLVLTGLSLNYTRWYALVRALGLQFPLADAFRLGSLGLLLSQVWFGSVGGDLFKAVFVAREQPGKRTEAIASVVIDRVVGMYGMLLVASCGWLVAGHANAVAGPLRSLAAVVVGLAAMGTLGVALLMVPALTGPRTCNALRRIPAAGHTLARLFEAAGAYRRRRSHLFAGILLACCTHSLLVTAIWLIGRGLPVSAPSFSATFIVGPMSLCAAAIPLTPGGLGTFEAAMDQLYVAIGSSPGDGLLVALAFRLMTYVMAAVGAVYYLRARSTVGQVLHEAEDLAEAMEHADSPTAE
jgi:uncharacterized membrane protein YbhN (UPF0104 family)